MALPAPGCESRQHQEIGRLLIALLTHFCEATQTGYVLYKPFQMQLGADLPPHCPDVMVVGRRNLVSLKRTHVEGPADLVVEITSPESRGMDRGDKFFDYEAGGVRELWLLDPVRRQPEFYQLDDGHHFQPVAPGPDGVYRSGVLKGFWIRTAWLWQEPQPPLLDILKEWGLI